MDLAEPKWVSGFSILSVLRVGPANGQRTWGRTENRLRGTCIRLLIHRAISRKGFPIRSAPPDYGDSTLFSKSVLAFTNTTGVVLCAGIDRICPHSSKPPMPGIITSRTTMSKGSFLSSERASVDLSIATHSNPPSCRGLRPSPGEGGLHPTPPTAAATTSPHDYLGFHPQRRLRCIFLVTAPGQRRGSKRPRFIESKPSGDR